MAIDRPLLLHAPIVEAIVDFDCDMGSTFSVENAAREAAQFFGGQYPRTLRVSRGNFSFDVGFDGLKQPNLDHQIAAVQYRAVDEKQILQVRDEGFSFNRLEPYSSLDDYLPEIEKRWGEFVTFAKPIILRQLKLRYINRIRIPTNDGAVKPTDYFANAVEVAGPASLVLNSIFQRTSGFDSNSGYKFGVGLFTSSSNESFVEFILDIEVSADIESEPPAWAIIDTRIDGLRKLKNEIFEKSLTEKCLQNYQ